MRAGDADDVLAQQVALQQPVAGVAVGQGERALAGGDLLPGRIYLCGGGSRLPEIRGALADEGFAKRLPFARPPEVQILAPEHIDTIRDDTRLLEDQQDVTPMGLAFQAIELGNSQNALDAALRRVVKAMKI